MAACRHECKHGTQKCVRHIAILLLIAASCSRNDGLQRTIPATGVLKLPRGVIELHSELRLPAAAHDLEITGDPAGTTLRASSRFHGRAIFLAESAERIHFENFTIDGNRDALEQRTGLPPSNVPFAKFTQASGVLADAVTSLEITNVNFRRIAGFAILVSRSRGVTIERVRIEDSGSRNPKGRNNATGGILLEEGTLNFRVSNCELDNIRGNGIWTHSLYTSPRNADGVIADNRLRNLARDAIQVGHAVNVRVEHNAGQSIGFPVAEVDTEGAAIPVAIDTAGNTERCVYAENRFEEINGKCIDLDGFHDGEVRANVCVNRAPPEHYPSGNFGIIMNHSNPDMRPDRVRIVDNQIDGTLFGGIYVIGAGNTIARNRLSNINMAHCNENAAKFGCYYPAGEPDLLRAGIYLGKGVVRPAQVRDSIITDNRIGGFQMQRYCVVAAPTVDLKANRVERNLCENVSASSKSPSAP